MRVLVFHGYMLRGTGSNIYNASLARALVDLGHEVHLLCQDRGAGELDFVDAVGTWESGSLEVRRLREPVRCTAYLPPIGRVLPVYVADEYEDFDALMFPELTDAQLDAYLEANVGAVRDVAERVTPDAALANHAVMGPAVLARALGAGRYAVKIHGSALEYTVKPHPDRFLPYAREGIGGAAGVLVGSRHTAESLWDAIGDPELPARTRLGPPGVDAAAFRLRTPPESAAALRELADRVEAGEAASWGGDPEAAAALRALAPEREPTVVFVGKLIVSKGVDLLLAAWPLVHGRAPSARLCIVGFGTYREGLERLAGALGSGDLEEARRIAARGRELEGGAAGELRWLGAFLDTLGGEDLEGYVQFAASAFERIHWTGRLEHADVPDLLSACSVQVVPSTFPEAFGMVAIEAAACGALPVSAAHSGLAEVASALAPALEEDLRRLLTFEVGPGSVRDIAARLGDWLALEAGRRDRARSALSDLARRRFGWDAVARGVLAASAGRLSELPEPRPASG